MDHQAEVVGVVRGRRVVSRNKPILCVDFDGVIHSYSSPWVAEDVIPDPPVPGAIQWLNRISDDFDIVIFTTRGKNQEGRNAVGAYLRAHGCELSYPITAEKPMALVYLSRSINSNRGTSNPPPPRRARAGEPTTHERLASTRTMLLARESMGGNLEEHESWLLDTCASLLADRAALVAELEDRDRIIARHLRDVETLAARIESLTRDAATTGEPVASDAWLVWSFEHDAWWGPNGCGYNANVLRAGIYSEADAKEIERNANGDARQRNEKAMSLSDVLADCERLNTVGRWLRSHPDPQVAALTSSLEAATRDAERLDWLLCRMYTREIVSATHTGEREPLPASRFGLDALMAEARASLPSGDADV